MATIALYLATFNLIINLALIAAFFAARVILRDHERQLNAAVSSLFGITRELSRVRQELRTHAHGRE